jgi:hypothetical protein
MTGRSQGRGRGGRSIRKDPAYTELLNGPVTLKVENWLCAKLRKENASLQICYSNNVREDFVGLPDGSTVTLRVFASREFSCDRVVTPVIKSIERQSITGHAEKVKSPYGDSPRKLSDENSKVLSQHVKVPKGPVKDLKKASLVLRLQRTFLLTEEPTEENIKEAFESLDLPGREAITQSSKTWKEFAILNSLAGYEDSVLNRKLAAEAQASAPCVRQDTKTEEKKTPLQEPEKAEEKDDQVKPDTFSEPADDRRKTTPKTGKSVSWKSRDSSDSTLRPDSPIDDNQKVGPNWNSDSE